MGGGIGRGRGLTQSVDVIESYCSVATLYVNKPAAVRDVDFSLKRRGREADWHN